MQWIVPALPDFSGTVTNLPKLNKIQQDLLCIYGLEDFFSHRFASALLSHVEVALTGSISYAK